MAEDPKNAFSQPHPTIKSPVCKRRALMQNSLRGWRKERKKRRVTLLTIHSSSSSSSSSLFAPLLLPPPPLRRGSDLNLAKKCLLPRRVRNVSSRLDELAKILVCPSQFPIICVGILSILDFCTKPHSHFFAHLKSEGGRRVGALVEQSHPLLG